MCDYARVGFENMAVEERLTPHLNWLHVENLCHPALEKETHTEREKERMRERGMKRDGVCCQQQTTRLGTPLVNGVTLLGVHDRFSVQHREMCGNMRQAVRWMSNSIRAC